MKGMIKAELFKFLHTGTLWIILGILIISCGMSIVSGIYGSAEITLVSISKDSMVLTLSCAIYGAIILTEDFSNGLLRHYISNGYKRSTILLCKCLHYVFGCDILILLYQTICVSLSFLFLGAGTSFGHIFVQALITSFAVLPLYLGICGFFFLLAIVIKSGVAVMGVSVAASILSVVFTNKLYYSGMAPALKYSPVIQICEVAGGTAASDYFLSILFSAIFFTACVFGSIMKLNRDELR